MHRRTHSLLGGAWLSVALTLFAGCQSGPPPGRSKPSATVASSAKPPATSAAGASAAAARPAATQAAVGASAKPSSEPTTVTFADGATVRVPAGNIATPPPKSLPAEVHKAHKFQLGGPKQLLLLNEMDTGGKSCAARLDLEWDKLQRARADDDPARLKVRQVAKVEDLKVAGQRVLFSEAQQTARGGPNNEELAAPIVTAMMCPGKTLLVFMYAGTTKRPAREVRELLMGVVGSYSAKKP